MELQTDNKDLQLLINAQNRIVGSKKVLRAIENKTVVRVFLANDVDTFLFQTIMNASQEAGIPITRVESRDILGNACNIQVKTAAAAVCK